ncbi:hypothetical protein ABQF17_10340 [Mycolicibacterium elephantis]|uniref:hypothetical protein n=1 Tax=Mycolicibacterium elephantis TaxID=81858 RepID=UPI0006291BE3|nr:hypothetical protein [Mycolicibacterium elephantis]KKW63318.1 hypothetical protein AAV95_17760 [Mycolicibacterium elephantis]OBA67248.1 hypothetical protein A5633_26560 [Mycolicibacterium elephantis]OBB24011.1 hypothetical protein A5762_12720 [Mycolicibacterium elephantis]
MKIFPQPTELFISEAIAPVDGTCERCADRALARYRVVDYRGWLRVVKCRSCLHTVEAQRIESPVLSGEV